MDPSYNNSLGSSGVVQQPAQVAPASSGAGDIVLAPGKKSSKRKWIIIAVLVAVFVAVVAGVVALVVTMNRGGGAASSPAFDRYANYALYGENSDASMKNKTYDVAYEYFFETIFDSSNSEELLGRVGELQNAFSATLGENNAEIKEVLSEQNLYLELAGRVLTVDAPFQDDLFAMYGADGQEGARGAYYSYYGEAATEDSLLAQYINIYRAWIDKELEMFDFYGKYGCVGGKYLDNGCLAQNATEEDKTAVAAIRAESASMYAEMNSMRQVEDSFVDNVFVIKTLIYGGGVQTNNTDATGGDDE